MQLKDYTQCLLCKDDHQQIVYIPTKFAILGNNIKLLDDGIWRTGWIVKAIYGTIDSDKNLLQRDIYRDFKNVLEID